jgi:hypothetical protein
VPQSIEIKIIADDAAYFPKEVPGGAAEVLASIDASSSGNQRIFPLTHRASAELDCGITIEVPEGYKAIFKPTYELMKEGIVVRAPDIVGSGRVRILLANVGRNQPYFVKYLQPLALMEVVPIYSNTFKSEIKA